MSHIRRCEVHRGILALVVCFAAAPVMAEWNPGDDYKMHFPQLPDADGWDVYATYYEGLADDWQCSDTGLVEDIHFWGSWMGDVVGDIEFFHVAIWSNDAVGDGGMAGEDLDNTYSLPLERLWHEDFHTSLGEIEIVPYGTPTLQGWLDPRQEPDAYIEDNHSNMYQYNLYPDGEWAGFVFEQQVDEIYWLEISCKVEGFDPPEKWGWKTADVDSYPTPYTGNHFMDDAIWAHTLPTNVWMDPLEDPLTSVSLDLAFVITPEPGTLGLLLVGGLALLRRRS